MFCLSQEWKDKLDNVRIESSGDYWLKWLCYYVPDLPRAIKDITLDTKNRIELKNAEERNLLVEATAPRITLKERDEGRPNPQETNSPTGTPKFRLPSSKTWPRKQKPAIK